MDIKDFKISALMRSVFELYPSFRFRDRDPKVHSASEAAWCKRKATYKKLGYEQSNPTDYLGSFRMGFGNFIESGLKYAVFSKMAPFGVVLLGSQGDTGEYDFYGTKWHGYRDFDLGIKQENGKYKHVVMELKTKVGISAVFTLTGSAFSTRCKLVEPDTEWGYAQQLSLYMRDAYHKTNKPPFSEPTTDGVLVYYCYGDKGLSGVVEMWAKYLPDIDAVQFYETRSNDFPDCEGELNLLIKLKDIADNWKIVDDYIDKGELAPPDYQIKYPVTSPFLQKAYKSHLQQAAKNKKVIGDTQCVYCPYRDQCAKDQDIDLGYTTKEIQYINKMLKDR